MRDALSGLFGNWFDAKGFTVWKLHTTWDYIIFAAIIAVGVIATIVATNLLSKHRNQSCAIRRVAKKMKRLGGAGAVCYTNRLVRSKKDEHFYELICVALDRVYVVKVFHFGLEVTGGASARQWCFKYNKEKVWEDNPLPDLEEQKVVLTRVFMRAQIKNIPIETLVVFADNYGTTRFALEGVSCALSASYLSRWRKDHPLKGTKLNKAEVCKALEETFAAAESAQGETL